MLRYFRKVFCLRNTEFLPSWILHFLSRNKLKWSGQTIIKMPRKQIQHFCELFVHLLTLIFKKILTFWKPCTWLSHTAFNLWYQLNAWSAQERPARSGREKEPCFLGEFSRLYTVSIDINPWMSFYLLSLDKHLFSSVFWRQHGSWSRFMQQISSPQNHSTSSQLSPAPSQQT